MNSLRCSYLAFLVLLCLGFSFGHRILLDTTKNNDAEKNNQTQDHKDLEQTHGTGGGSNQQCQGGGSCYQQPQQPCPVGKPCQGQGGLVPIPGFDIPGISIPPVQVPPISIPIPVPEFPVPAQPAPCPPQNCQPGSCPPQNCQPGPCPPQNCQPGPCPPQKKDVATTKTELKQNDAKDQEVESEMTKTNRDYDGSVEGKTNRDYDDSVDAKTQSMKSDMEAGQGQVHH